ncbi:membrane fusion protein (multidrug efflux system) [Rhizobium sp. ERR 922]|uniref:HlyD family secretion protein n=1 Tax=unclassified Rhizobium TaxID=2613769 RepID=UPI0011A6CC10|nr:MULTISPECIES: HlyD family secretion protein [unclassified Rhizobium]TWB47463.1 membrane fusion protein (multidrug efflux system) [Rhizobium sp. ERR 922]TWB90907.1 membrane fusion protein (multidrug efflux system) [Rhizobium sp. ERR 942]
MSTPQDETLGKLIVLEPKSAGTKVNHEQGGLPAEQERAEAPRPGDKTLSLDENETPEPDDPGREDAIGSPSRRRRMLLIGGSALAAAAMAAFLYWDDASHYESTDDAFIAARQYAITSRVAGYISSVPVTDNQHVASGEVIARIDDRDYQTALEQAQAQVAAANANIKNTQAQKRVQQANVEEAEAQVAQAEANLVFAQQQNDRYQGLVKSGSGTLQEAQQYTSQLHQQQAALNTDQASLTAARRQLDAYDFQIANVEATLKQDQAQLDQAKLNLSYTTMAAAQPGRVVQLSAGDGEYVQAGTNLAMFVPDKLWVTANFKETQLDHMRPGQPVTLTIDAYGGRTIHGHVASVQPGSGTAFSLLPAENATGNYVKIVQRVPVKIELDDVPSDLALGPGMSVVPTVRTNASPSLWESLRNVL